MAKTLDTLDADECAEFCTHVREAMYHLASCWDALREAESIVEGEIETDDISGIDALAEAVGV